MKKQLLTAAVIAAASAGVSAEQFWADNSFSALYGNQYTMTPDNTSTDNELTTLTLEHVSGHSWGGVFFFVDRHVGEDEFRETYGEVSPKFTLTSFEDSIVKNINAAFTYEFGTSAKGGANAFSQDNYLYGIGADLAIPGMDFASVTYYYAQRNNTFSSNDDDHQITLTYGWHAGNFNIDGFLDYSTGTSKHDSEMNFTPQLTYNLGPALGVKNKVKVGVEYSYWNNKFGQKGVEDSKRDQNAVSLLLKVHL
ncbi:hypothetical protein [Bacterioplanoides sp.]|uniref:hypothetical protein n=1 Tax=Bacterioplanoides sp. TaxID=2066072 RepID=UPI003B5A59E1